MLVFAPPTPTLFTYHLLPSWQSTPRLLPTCSSPPFPFFFPSFLLCCLFLFPLLPPPLLPHLAAPILRLHAPRPPSVVRARGRRMFSLARVLGAAPSERGAVMQCAAPLSVLPVAAARCRRRLLFSSPSLLTLPDPHPDSPSLSAHSPLPPSAALPPTLLVDAPPAFLCGCGPTIAEQPSCVAARLNAVDIHPSFILPPCAPDSARAVDRSWPREPHPPTALHCWAPVSHSLFLFCLPIPAPIFIRRRLLRSRPRTARLFFSSPSPNRIAHRVMTRLHRLSLAFPCPVLDTLRSNACPKLFFRVLTLRRFAVIRSVWLASARRISLNVARCSTRSLIASHRIARCLALLRLLSAVHALHSSLVAVAAAEWAVGA